MIPRSPALRPLLALLLLAALTPSRAGAQRLAPISAAERCDGRPIAAIEFVGARRPLLSRRFDPAARVANEAVLVLQPATRVRLLRRFMLMSVGDVCNEQQRVESERILRAQSYISDAAVRVLPHTSGGVRLRVETIDEYVLYFESWGWEGLPAGLELGTGSVGGTGKGLRLLAEVGRGSEMGWGARYKDTQFAGRPIIFEAGFASRPRVDHWNLAFTRPFYTNFQRTSWQASIGSFRALYALLDTAVHGVSVEYERRTAVLGGSRRIGPVNAPWNVGASMSWERAEQTRVLQLRDDGFVPILAPPQVATRYPYYDAARVGLSVGYRRVRFVPVRGIGALSAPEDVAKGHDAYLAVGVGVGAMQREPTDRTLLAGTTSTFGGERALLRLFGRSSWISERPGAVRGQTALEGGAALLRKSSEAHLTKLTIAGATFRNARVPTQLNFRDDETGLLGYRTADLGGAARVIIAAEERHRLPLNSRRVEIALAGLAQTGRLWAGDAPFGVTTPWRTGVGLALVAAVPAGAKQTFRLEVGVPVNPPPGLQGREVRLFYSDRTGRF
ncbi:MAG: hypothetical protein P3B98_02185 [Gemmatimonadota bacterium]|nr:hypothetical protein [Gemmatimonadota bacterium]